jgi:long-chain fatty acid transport protein
MTAKSTAVLLAFLVAAVPLAAQTFEEQSARAAGVAGAFAAQVDDPSAVWYNPGALGLLKKKKGATVGVEYSKTAEGLFQGFTPGIAGGTAAEQETGSATLPFGFVTVPIGAKIVSGIGVYKPLRIDSQWADPGAYAGRFLATSSKIDTLDVATMFAVGGANVGVGGGAIMRQSSITSSRRLGTTVSGALTDVATLDMKTDDVRAYGWAAGLAVRPSPAFSLGVTYRSPIQTDYEGAGTLTQILTGNTQVDTLVAASFPFGEDVALLSTLEFPSQVTAGIAFALGKPLLLEIDATQTDWSTVPALPFVFPNTANIDAVVPLRLEKSTDVRAGLTFALQTGPKIRVGYAILDTPQPDETVGAFLSSAKRNVATAGFGLDWLDMAFMWWQQDDRDVTTSVDQLNGRYRGNGWAVMMSVTK